MTKRWMVSSGLIVLMVTAGTGAVTPRSADAPAPAASGTLSKIPPPTPQFLPVFAATKPVETSDLWTRPAPKVAARNSRRSGFAWILRQLGATKEQLDRLADLDIAGLIEELKQKARAGDPASINILGEIAYQNCYLGRDDATVEGYVDSQIRDIQAVPAIDASWFTEVMHEDQAFYRKVRAACADVDLDQVMSWVKARADQGDGASSWLMFRDSTNMTEMQQLLRESAATGFPQAQFELAWAIIGGQQGAAGIGSDKVTAGDELRASLVHLPRSEMQLAVCEYSGCDGVAVDVDAAIKHAREAAQHGELGAMTSIGPRIAASQLDPNEVTAWGLVQALLLQRGCGGSGFSVQTMKNISNTLNAKNISDQARTLAEGYWRDYGARMMNDIGCGP